jgi:hypothetical protein
MDNLSDKEKTLDMFSLPLALMETYLEPFYDPSGQQSPVSIEVYKSAFQWSKNTEIYNYATGNFNKNDIILWSFSLKIKVFPSIPLDALSTLLNALKIMPTPITLPD